jgi:hypothetical protein
MERLRYDLILVSADQPEDEHGSRLSESARVLYPVPISPFVDSKPKHPPTFSSIWFFNKRYAPYPDRRIPPSLLR